MLLELLLLFLASLLILFVPKLSVDMLPNPDLFHNWEQLPFVFIISYLGWYFAVKLKIPGPTIIGPMIFSALIHIFEIVEAMPMYVIVIAVQILLGSALGCLFKNITLKEISGPVLAGLITTLIAIIPLLIIYFILINIGYDPLSILLAFSRRTIRNEHLSSFCRSRYVIYKSTSYVESFYGNNFCWTFYIKL